MGVLYRDRARVLSIAVLNEEAPVTMNSNDKRQRIVYRPPPFKSDIREEGTHYYIVTCPVCDKRTIDVSALPKSTIVLRYKCPHCRHIILVPLVIQPKDGATADY